MVVDYLPESTIFNFITNDFESAWNALAKTPGDNVGRGNFIFALHASILLEWAVNLTKKDQSARADLVSAIERIDKRYFSPLPYPLKKSEKLFGRTTSTSDLIDVVFELVRNGQAHQYHQIMVQLSDSAFGVSLGGAHFGNTLDKLEVVPRPSDHLSFRWLGATLWLLINSGIFYADIRKAIEESHLLNRGLKFGYIRRRKPASARDFEAALLANGHTETHW